jgi:hypothetical protein
MPLRAQQATDFLFLLNEGGAPQTRQQIRIPDHLKKAVEKAEIELSKPEMKQWGALVFTVLSEDGKMLAGKGRLYDISKGKATSFRPSQILEDEPVVHVSPHGTASELRIVVRGYQSFARQTVFRKGEIIIWDDIVLDRIRPGEETSLSGEVVLEDDADSSHLTIFMEGEEICKTDEEGRFNIEGLRAGEVTISSRKHGYTGLQKIVTLTKGQQASCELQGYRLRGIRIRWGRTPEGSNSFRSLFDSGVSLLFPDRNAYFTFRHGLERVEAASESDFALKQNGLSLVLAVATVGRPASLIEAKSGFNQVLEAPEGFYSVEDVKPKVGGVYVLKARDESYFVKMEIIEIVDSD